MTDPTDAATEYEPGTNPDRSEAEHQYDERVQPLVQRLMDVCRELRMPLAVAVQIELVREDDGTEHGSSLERHAAAVYCPSEAELAPPRCKCGKHNLSALGPNTEVILSAHEQLDTMRRAGVQPARVMVMAEPPPQLAAALERLDDALGATSDPDEALRRKLARMHGLPEA